MDDDGEYGNDSTDGQATRVTHEYLRGEGVVPKETNQGTDEGTDEDNQFFASRDKHDVQVTGILDVTGHISQYPKRKPDDGGISGCHPVHPVVQIGTIGNRRYHKNGYYNKEHPTGGLFVFAHKTYQIGIVQIVVLEEWYSGFCRLLVLCLVYYFHNFSTFLYFHILADNHVGTEVKCQTYYQAQAYLTDNLELSV